MILKLVTSSNSMDYFSVGLILIKCLTTVSALSPALILTPLTVQNKTAEARNRSLVDPSLFLNVTSHSGFLTVDERYNSNTFFWYFPVEGKPVNETPWILWLQGGPGASSLAGIFDEIGPFEYDEKERILKLRKSSWSKEYSMLFIDNPIGAGYSFTNSPQGFATNMSTYTTHLYSSLQQFLTIFPELRPAPLYLAGESYSGRYVPALGMAILDNKLNGTGKLSVNLQGLMLGNPVLNRADVSDYTSLFQQWGLVDTQGALAVKPLQDDLMEAIRNGKELEAYVLRDNLLDKLQELAQQTQTFNLLAEEYHFNGFENYIEQEAVREAMHVGDLKFSFDNSTVHDNLIPDFLSKIEPKMEKLLDNYRILIYCGQLDLTAPCIPNAKARRNRWQWGGRNDFLKSPRVPWWYNESVSGYVKSGGRFTEVLVRGAGHLVPIDKPDQTLQLISHFIQGIDLPIPPNYPTSVPLEVPDFNLPTTKPSSTIPPPPHIPEVPAQPKPKINTDKEQNLDTQSGSVKTGLIFSMVLNVILVLILVTGVIFYKRWRRREENFYNAVDNNSDDIFLT